ncbi:MAG: tetratricopeptide (TPR) repeat protein, partial [Planctomycetota bacterium]
MVVRIGALCALLWLSQPLVSQSGQSPAVETLNPSVVSLVEKALATSHPESQADALWQAAAAAHGEVRLLIDMMQARIASNQGSGASRLLCGILRYQGQPQKAMRVLDGIPVGQRTDGDLLLRAELLDTLSRGDDAARAYDELLKKQLEPTLRRRILFRRALVGSDSIAQLKSFAKSPELDREQRNQAAIILALRNEPAAALELYDVQGEGTERFRQLVRLAEWALAAKDYKKAQECGWEAVQVAKMKRDRRYALTVVVSAYRAGDAVEALLKRLEASPELKDDARQVWIDLLRDEGRVEDALRLFRQGSDGDQGSGADQGKGKWTPALRRQLLEICRETGREDVLISQFRELMTAEPDNLEWRSGLSRHFLENGDRAEAKAAWHDFGKGNVTADRQLEAAYSLMDLGLDDLALRAAGIAIQSEGLRETAQLFVVKLHVDRGRFDEASAMLQEIEGKADGQDAVLAEVAGIYERMDRLDRAVQVLDRMREAFGGFLGTDLDMKYALLLSKVNREPDALVVWRSLWAKVRSTPRGRYVEDRMMTVAARLGVLAKIAIELEDKLDAGTADTTDVELLVRLYVKVGDSAAATEITEQALRTSDASDLDIIRRKATIYLACQDYLEYERLIEQLIERDTENRLDHMRELTLSRLERGRRAQAIEKLPALRAAEDDSGIADEFEAGIYQLAGLNELALKSYVKGLGRFPDRIDTHLLVANLMRETGREMEAARRFQYLASTAKRDDLFTIAIDGILNLRAQDDTQVPKSVVDWAMRVTLERLAERSHRFYLHRLAADLAEEMNDMPMSIRTLTAGIPVAGERRTALLREILGKVRSLDKNARVMFGGSRRQQISPEWDPAPYVMIGRRLLGQGEVVPPQVYMDLAAIFLHVKAVPDAMRTFSRAAELLDRGEVHRQAAAVLEEAERYDGALKFYRRLLSVDANDVGLLVKIGRLEELAGRDVAARQVYEQGLAAALRQTAPRVHVATEEEPDPNDIYGFVGRQRSVDAITTAMPKLVEGLLVTMSEQYAGGYLLAMQKQVEQDLLQANSGDGADEATLTTIDQFPRLAVRADILRRLCLCYRQLEIADA